jgi:hypothetical protein
MEPGAKKTALKWRMKMSVKQISRLSKPSSLAKEARLYDKVTTLPLEESDNLLWDFAASLSVYGWKVKLYLPFGYDLITLKVRHGKGAKIK